MQTNYSNLKRIILIIVVFAMTYPSCKVKRKINPDDINNKIVCYKPRYGQVSAFGQPLVMDWYWQACYNQSVLADACGGHDDPNNKKLLLPNECPQEVYTMDGSCFIDVDLDNSTSGLNKVYYGEISNTNSYPLVNVQALKDAKDGKISSSNLPYQRFQTALDALDNCSYYEGVRTQATIARLNMINSNPNDPCLQNYYTCLNELTNGNICNLTMDNLRYPNCPGVANQVADGTLYDLFVTNPTDLLCTYGDKGAKYISPILKSDYYNGYYTNCAIDHVYDVVKDVGLREAYIKVEIKSPLSYADDYYLQFQEKGNTVTANIQQIDFTKDQSATNSIVYCSNSGPTRTFAAKVSVPNAGTFKADLYNRTSNALVESLEINFNASDNYDALAGSTMRGIVLYPINVTDANIGGNITSCSLAVHPSFYESLDDAFSHNKKYNLTAPIDIHSINTGIEFTVTFPCSPAASQFDTDGKIKIRLSDVQTHITSLQNQGYTMGPGLMLKAYTEVLDIALGEISESLIGGCTSSISDGDYFTQGLVVAVPGLVVVDASGVALTKANLTSLGITSEPKDVLGSLYGITGPSSNAIGYKNGVLSVVFTDALKAAALTSSIKEATFIVLAHELGSLWSARQMGDMGATSSTNQYNNFCGGKNNTVCAYRLPFTTTNFGKHKSFGVHWCDVHQQIFLNQLIRKY